MATIDELFAQGHTSMRLPVWALGSYIKLDVLDGNLGPWVHLHSPIMDPISVLLVEASKHTDWESCP